MDWSLMQGLGWLEPIRKVGITDYRPISHNALSLLNRHDRSLEIYEKELDKNIKNLADLLLMAESWIQFFNDLHHMIRMMDE